MAVAALLALAACSSDYDADRFRKAVEQAYAEAHPGWTILRKKAGTTYFHRGDQIDALDVDALFAEYEASGQSGSAFVRAWTERSRAAYEALRRTLDEAREDVLPLLKSAKWIRYQDLGAIGPARRLPELRPFRHEVTEGLFVVLGIPEDRLGIRVASMAEVERSGEAGEVWVERATRNLAAAVEDEVLDEDGAYRGVGVDVKGRLKAFDLVNARGVSGLLLDPAFRAAMLDRFAMEELGAAVPIRDVLIVFDPDDFVAVKPARNRAHQLYDTQNHPGFRGLLKFDAERIGVLEPPRPER